MRIVLGLVLILFLVNEGCVKKASQEANQKPRFSFVHVCDLHVEHPDGGAPFYRRGNERAAWLFDALGRKEPFENVDFLIAVGDLVQGKDKARIERNLGYFKQDLLPRLAMPVYGAIGNHEHGGHERDSVWERPFKDALGLDALDYSFVHKGVEFIAINNGGTWKTGPEIGKARAAELERLLKQGGSLPRILFLHVPLIAMREEKVLHRSFGPPSFRNREPDLLALVRKPEHRVKAVLSGHLHLSGQQRDGKTHHITVSGTASWPHQVGLYEVYDDRIEVAFHRLPEHLWEAGTNVHGPQRHKVEITDAAHKSHLDYVAGNAGEQSFVIPLY